MRRGTWLRPMVNRAGLFSHYFPDHTTNTPFLGNEVALCGKGVLQLPPAAMRQDWRCPWTLPSTCQECVAAIEVGE